MVCYPVHSDDNATDPVSLRGTGSVVINNAGYNPVGDIPDPWPASGGDLTNDVTAGSPNPQSGTVYTVRHSPKTIVVTGGDLSQITINGVDTGLTAGVFKLGIGETIAVTYDTLLPTSAIFAEYTTICQSLREHRGLCASFSSF